MSDFVRLHHTDGSITHLRADRVLSITETRDGCRVRTDSVTYEVVEDALEVLGVVQRALNSNA